MTFLSGRFIVKSVLNQQPNVDPVLQALADPTRRQIVERLGEGPQTVKQLAQPLPMSLAAVMCSKLRVTSGWAKFLVLICVICGYPSLDRHDRDPAAAPFGRDAPTHRRELLT